MSELESWDNEDTFIQSWQQPTIWLNYQLLSLDSQTPEHLGT